MYLLSVSSVSSRYLKKINKMNVLFREIVRLIARNSLADIFFADAYFLAL